MTTISLAQIAPKPPRRRRRAARLIEPFPGAPAQSVTPSVDTILREYQDVAAGAFPDARRLALALQREGHELRFAALSLALTFADLGHIAHQAAELCAELEWQEGGAQWS